MYFYVDLMVHDGHPCYLIEDEKRQRYAIDLTLFLKMVNRQFTIKHPILGRIILIIAVIVSKTVYPMSRDKKRLTLSLGEKFARKLPRMREVIGDELFNDFMNKSKIIDMSYVHTKRIDE
jgi:hypothetical protein